VPEVEEGGADVELQYVEVNEDTEEPQSNFVDEGKPRFINLKYFCKFMQLPMDVCAFTLRS
jgi:hypothetical protein